MPRSAADTEAAIVSLQAQCMLLGDNVVDAAVQALRAEAAAMGAAALAQSQTQAQMHAHTHTQAHTQAHANAPAAPAPQLRQVSVLFLDIVGSTRLSQSLAPEDIQDVMDGALACFTDVVQRHQGSVLQYAGDSLLAAFGAAQAREDDAECAVLAGLALLDESRRQAQWVDAMHGAPGFDVRVGCTPAAGCWAAGWAMPAASAARPSTSQHGWNKQPGPAHCASATTPAAMCKACSIAPRRRGGL